MDINKNINIKVDTGNSEAALNGIENKLDKITTGHTKVTQSTSSLSKETKSLNGNLLQNGGAMGLLSAATGGLAMDFKDAVEAVGGLGISLKGLRGALIATGIGALAILVLDLVSNWEKYTGAINGSTAALEKYNAEYARFEDDKRTNQLLFDKEIAALEAQLLLLEAQGASEDKINKQKETNRSVTLSFYDKEQKRLQDIIDLEQTRYSLAKDSAGNDLSDAEREESYNKRRNAEVDLNKLQIERNKLISDPIIKAAQEATNKRLQNQKNRTDAVKKAQQDLNNVLGLMTGSVKTLLDINNNLRDISLVDLSSSYSKMKQLEDSFYQNRDAIKEVNKQIEAYQRLSKSATKEQNAEYNINKKKADIYRENVKVIQELIEKQKGLSDQDEADMIVNKTTQIAIVDLMSQYDELTKSVSEYQRTLNFGDYEKVTETVVQQNKAYELQRDILIKNNEIEKRNNTTKLKNLILGVKENENSAIEILKTNTNYDETYKKYLAKGYDEKLSAELAYDTSLREMQTKSTEKTTELQDLEIQRFFDFNDKKNDYAKQQDQLELDIEKSTSDSKLELKALELDHLQTMELDAMEVKYQAQQEYAEKEQILTQNVFGVMSALQNEAIIKSKDFRNALLVAQKGAEIAQVVINTLRENTALKIKAADYTKQAGLNTALAAGAIDPVSKASFAAAATSYTTAAAKTAAQIPLNFKIAAAGIAGILATTATSWNTSSGGGGGGGDAGGGGAQAQFNVVGASGENQLAAQIARQQNQPVNAFVVGTDVTTQQALDRNKITNASFL